MSLQKKNWELKYQLLQPLIQLSILILIFILLHASFIYHTFMTTTPLLTSLLTGLNCDSQNPPILLIRLYILSIRKYSHHDRFQAISMKSLDEETGISTCNLVGPASGTQSLQADCPCWGQLSESGAASDKRRQVPVGRAWSGHPALSFADGACRLTLCDGPVAAPVLWIHRAGL